MKLSKCEPRGRASSGAAARARARSSAHQLPAAVTKAQGLQLARQLRAASPGRRAAGTDGATQPSDGKRAGGVAEQPRCVKLARAQLVATIDPPAASQAALERQKVRPRAWGETWSDAARGSQFSLRSRRIDASAGRHERRRGARDGQRASRLAVLPGRHARASAPAGTAVSAQHRREEGAPPAPRQLRVMMRRRMRLSARARGVWAANAPG